MDDHGGARGQRSGGVEEPMTATTRFRPSWWVPGDWNAFFGLFTNVLLNVHRPDRACAWASSSCPTTSCSAASCRRSASRCRSATCTTPTSPSSWRKKEGRDDVTAMPYGPSVPHMFIVVFVIMLPVYLQDQATRCSAWQAGLAWCLHHRRHRAARRVRRPDDPRSTRRAPRCSARWPASRSRSSRCGPAFQMWEVPWIAFVSLRASC